MMNPRLFFAVVWLSATSFAAPSLTTIQDVLYKADGTRFNGILTIAWKSFQAADRSAIATQSITVKVVDGALRVQLVPTTNSYPAGYYSVLYNSDGRVQFQEKWMVPPGDTPVRVRDVRIAGDALGGFSSNDTTGTPVQESDVIGLIADLGARPVKGAGFAAGRVAMVSALGSLEAVSGVATDCVRVDGSSGPCGSTAPSFVDGDSLAGIVDGANTTFSLSATPQPASSLAVYRNGLLQKIGQDYTVSNRNVQFVTGSAPAPGDTLLASYRLEGDDTGTAPVFPSAQVLCSGTGAATNTTSLSSIGSCTIPAGVLVPGDRVQVKFDFAHQGTLGAFSFEVHWGATTAVHRDAASGDVLATGRYEAAILESGVQLSAESWGTLLPLAASVANAADAYADGMTIDFQGKVSSAADTVTLRNFTVIRFP